MSNPFTEKVGATDWVIALLVVAVGFYFVWPSGDADTQQPTASAASVPERAVTQPPQPLAAQFTLPDQLPGAYRATTRHVIQLFLDACPGIGHQFDAYRVTAVRHGDGLHFEAERYGWPVVMEIMLTHRVPDLFDPDRMVVENLYYTLGGGAHPGIRAGKHSSRRMCGGFPATDNSEFLLPVPGMRVIDALQ